MARRISFLMPTFNRAALIGESVQSVLAEMGPDDELIVIDDGSTDGVKDALAPFADRIRYIAQENAGKSAALNNGIASSDSEYIWIVDDDDLLRAGCVEALVTAAGTHRAGFVFGRYRRFVVEDGVKTVQDAGYWPDLGHGSILRHLLEDHFIFHNAALVRRDAYETAGPFDTALFRSQDYDMFLRLTLAAGAAFVDKTVFEQRQHPGARGPQASRHASGKTEAVWNSFDGDIFGRLHRIVPLDLFADMFEAQRPEHGLRAAHLQRACVMGRHNQWDEAIDDIEVALRTLPSTRLSGVERDICHRMVNGKYGFAPLLDHGRWPGLCALLEETSLGQEIFAGLSDGVVWQTRKHRGRRRRDALALLRANGLGKTLFRVARHRVHGRRNELSDSVVERAVSPTLSAAKAAQLKRTVEAPLRLRAIDG